MSVQKPNLETKFRQVVQSFRTGIKSSPFLDSEFTEADAYEVQYRLIEQLTASGEIIRGHKVALTTKAARIDGHSSGTLVTERLVQPTRIATRKHAFRLSPICHPYLVLLLVGFTLPPEFLPVRCALTTPFHPYQAN